MRGWLAPFSLALALLMAALPGNPALAAEPPTDYPEEMRAWLSKVGPDRKGWIDRWWARMPAYFKESLMDAPFEEWREVIYCDYLGFRAGSPESEKCVQMRKNDWERNATQWNAKGEYVGPSRECLRRNETDKWGRLICVTDERREEVREWWGDLPREVKLRMFATPATEWEAVLSCRERGFEVGTSENQQCADNYAPEDDVPLY